MNYEKRDYICDSTASCPNANQYPKESGGRSQAVSADTETVLRQMRSKPRAEKGDNAKHVT